MKILKEFFEDTKVFLKTYGKYLKFCLVILCFLLSSIFKLIPIIIFNIDVSNLSYNENFLLSLFSNLVTLIIIGSLYFKKIKNNFINMKKMKKKDLLIVLGKCFIVWIIGLTIMNASNIVIQKMGISTATNDNLVRQSLKQSPIIFGISVFMISPIIEELVFRLSFRDVLKNNLAFILISGIIFGSIHVISLLNNPYELLYLIPYCSLGIAFSYMYSKTNNIYTSIFYHILHNISVAVFTLTIMGI